MKADQPPKKLPLLQLRGVSFSYPEGRPVVRDIDLQVREAESLVILGRSGEGKTTLLKIMAGLLRSQRGQLLVGIRSFYLMSFQDRAAWLRQTGMTFQNSGLFDSMTCRENLDLPLREAGMGPEERDRVIKQTLLQVELEGIEKLNTFEVSGGMRKRLGIARALVLSPQIIFYDEPTAGLDPITSRTITDLILKVRAEKKMTIVTVTSDVGQAFQLADRVAFVADGRIAETGTVKEFQNSKVSSVREFLIGQGGTHD